MHKGVAPAGRAPDGVRVEQIVAANQIEPGNLVAAPRQFLGNKAADIPAMPGDENPHPPMIAVSAPQTQNLYPERIGPTAQRTIPAELRQ
jgi:hypothetical protein